MGKFKVFWVALPALLLISLEVNYSSAQGPEPLIYRPTDTIEIDQLKNELKASSPVIFLPGVMGSRLADPKGNVLWGKSIWKMRGEFDRLALTCDGKEDDIKPAGLVNELLVIGKFLKIKQYSDILDFLSKMGINERAGNLLLFPYDWRKSNTESAIDLGKKIEEWMPAQKNPKAQFTVVAHSMGGLVAQYYINKLGGDQRIDKLILLGTPNYGSLKGLKMILGGLDDEVNTLIGEKRVRKAIVTFPSAYQLLPRDKSCCQMEKDGREEPIDLYDVKTWKKLKWIASSHFSGKCGWAYVEKQLQAAQDFHHSLDGVEKKVKIFKIVGFTQKTLERIVFGENGKEKRLDWAAGDGTVLEVSAARGDFTDNVQFVTEQHGSIYMDQIAKRRILKLVIQPHPKIDLYSNQLLEKNLDEAEWERIEKGQIYAPQLNRNIEVGLTHIDLNKSFYHPMEKITVAVEVKDKDGQALSGLTVLAKLQDQSTLLQENEANPSHYQGELKAPREADSYEIVVTLSYSSNVSTARVVRDFFEVVP